MFINKSYVSSVLFGLLLVIETQQKDKNTAFIQTCMHYAQYIQLHTISCNYYKNSIARPSNAL